MNAMKSLVSRQITIVSGNEESKSIQPTRINNPHYDPWTWNDYDDDCWCINGDEGTSNFMDEFKRPESGMYCSHWKWNEHHAKWHNIYDKSDVRHGSKDINPALIPTRWKYMYRKDWCTMIYSILLLKYNKHFCEDFCSEILELEIRRCFTTHSLLQVQCSRKWERITGNGGTDIFA